MEEFKFYEDVPKPLVDLCLNVIVKRPVNLSYCTLPAEVGNLIAGAFRRYGLAKHKLGYNTSIDSFRLLKHKYIPLTKIDFSGLPITEEFLMKFLEEYKDQLVEINISRCHLFENGIENLDLFNKLLTSNNTDKTLIVGDTLSNWINPKQRPLKRELFNSDLRLKKLVLHRVDIHNGEDPGTIYDTVLARDLSTMAITLRYLDLSWCWVGRGTRLSQLQSLEVLILYNATIICPDIITNIASLKKLRALDLSRLVDSDVAQVVGEDPKLLDYLICNLPLLSRLDISGTNLVGGKERSITAFERRIDKPFEFLGLFHTGNDAAYRSCIPALKIAGEADEDQLLNACVINMNRPEQLSRALNDLYNYYKTITTSETSHDVYRALNVVLPILTIHLEDEQLIIYTTAALYNIVKMNVHLNNLNDARVRRSITSHILDVMHYHLSSRVILVNGGLSLLFIPDIICEHSRVAKISLFMCRDTDPRTQGFGTTLLNTLACQVGGDQKIFIGELNAIETMINIINTKIEQSTCDEILETAWSTLWNITDETPKNCQRFLECQGLEAFESCMDKFDYNKEVLRNIMGLLGNVAECDHLRVHFMKERYINRFCLMLASDIDGIECSYNACGISAHLVSDGEKVWCDHMSKQTRLHLLAQMRDAISRWPINSKRNINYRSFEPIVRLLHENIAVEAQYWAVFALTNLTRINPAKYCPMLLPFWGLAKLRRLTEPDVTAPFVAELAAVAVYQYDRFTAEGTLAGLEQCDSIDLEVVKNFRAEPSQGDETSDMGEML